MKITTNKAPAHVCKKALCVLEQFRRGHIRARGYRESHYLSLVVSHHWRLLTKDKCQSWELMSHGKYDNELKK